MTNKENKRIKRRFMDLRHEFGDRCYFCGAIYDLQFAHVLPTRLSGKKGRGRKERYYDIKNNKDKYLLTCRTHNILADMNHNG